jgi:hypothetical protein
VLKELKDNVEAVDVICGTFIVFLALIYHPLMSYFGYLEKLLLIEQKKQKNVEFLREYEKDKTIASEFLKAYPLEDLKASLSSSNVNFLISSLQKRQAYMGGAAFSFSLPELRDLRSRLQDAQQQCIDAAAKYQKQEITKELFFARCGTVMNLYSQWIEQLEEVYSSFRCSGGNEG